MGREDLYPVRQVRHGLPHAVIRIKVYDAAELEGAPGTFKTTDARDKEWQGLKYTHPGRARRLHRMRHLRGHLPRAKNKNRSAAQGD